MTRCHLPALAALCALLVAGCGESAAPAGADSAGKVTLIANQAADVGCASCVYGLEHVVGHTLAAVISGKPLPVVGLEVNLAERGLCTAPQKARIDGVVRDGRVEATRLEFEEDT